MQCRRLENLDKGRFVEIFWEGGVAEITSGALGGKGRTRDHEFSLPRDCDEFVAVEVAKRLREGYVEVVPEVLRARDARHVAPDREWIARIAAAYDDDAPRVVYADHLASLGDPLGELIVVQCELAKLDGEGAAQARARVLREREETLLVTYRPRWLPKIGPEFQCTFVRGFVERVDIDAQVKRDAIEHLMAHAPLIRTIGRDWATSNWYERTPWDELPSALLRQLTGLLIRGWHAQAPGLRKLVEAPELAGIDRLGLRVCSISARDIGLLGTRAWRELDLHSNTIGLRGVESALGDVSRLEVLDVGSSGIGDAGALTLAKLPFERLRRLSVRRSALGPKSLVELSRAPGLATLTALDLSANHGIGSFFSGPALPALTELDLHDTALDDDALTQLLASPLAARLRALDLGGNELTDARLLIEAELPALRTLNVSGNPLGERARELKAGLPHVRVTARNAQGA
ncbi:MAG TPA: TIGR02996 domain-containing protein [Kofleriaceae bacterium]|jgi:uncharacterized protein (TIGR02996 family)|nr:TIGR02996 domain-containing protein [Kofleriaceae bacterium]